MAKEGKKKVNEYGEVGVEQLSEGALLRSKRKTGSQEGQEL